MAVSSKMILAKGNQLLRCLASQGKFPFRSAIHATADEGAAFPPEGRSLLHLLAPKIRSPLAQAFRFKLTAKSR